MKIRYKVTEESDDDGKNVQDVTIIAPNLETDVATESWAKSRDGISVEEGIKAKKYWFGSPYKYNSNESIML